jgi:hypothetical protein
METLIQDFTNKTNNIVEKINVEYKDSDKGVILRDPTVGISVQLGVNNSIQKEV